MTHDKYLKAYTQHKSNAKTRGIEMLMTFEQWKSVWADSGKFEERGRGAEKYCMCRVGDLGHYELGNVFIAKNKRNVSDGNKGKVDSDETRKKKSAAMSKLPRPWTSGDKNPMRRPEVKAKVLAAISGDNNYRAKKVISPFGVFGSATEAAKMLRIPAVTVQWRCRNNKLGFSYHIA